MELKHTILCYASVGRRSMAFENDEWEKDFFDWLK